VELDGVNGSTGQHFEVLLSAEQALSLNLQSGQRVRLLPSSLKIFQRENKADGGAAQ
jgi:sulfate transport system ATP-binding protein